MRRPNTELYVHCVWSTVDRQPLIEESIEPQLHAAIRAKCTELRCCMIAIGGTQDHVHVLVRYPPSMNVARLVKEMKGASSHLMNHVILPDMFFKWQGAYGAFAVAKDGIAHVAEYITSQKRRHRDGRSDSAHELEEPPERACQ